MNRQKTDLTGSPRRKGLARDLGGDLGLLHRLSRHAHSVGFAHREPAIGNWHLIWGKVFLHLTQEQLARAAGVSPATLAAFEAGSYATYDSTMDKIVAALEARGIEFLNGGRPGVRLHPGRAIIPS